MTMNRRQRSSPPRLLIPLLFILCVVLVVLYGSLQKSSAAQIEELQKSNASLTERTQALEEQTQTLQEQTKTLLEEKTRYEEQTKKQEETIRDLEKQLSSKTGAVAKDKNHSNGAASYAYDTKAVKEAIQKGTALNGEKVAFLTFDDGVNTTVTPQVLDILKKEGVPATFFIQCSTIGEKTKDILKRELREGHGIAMHSYSHDYSKLYPGRTGNADAIIGEVNRCQEVLKSHLGSSFHSKVFRYPGGHMSWNGLGASDERLSAMGIQWIDWNALNGDAEPKSRRPGTADGLVRYLDSSLQEGEQVAVILMHDATSKQLTVDALPQMIQLLRDKGYKFGILS